MADPLPEKQLDTPWMPGVEALRAALRQYVRQGTVQTPDDAWRRSARLMCEDARARALRVEQLLVSLKRTWPAVADAERVPRLESSRLLARFVTMCVQEYYGPLR